MKLTNNTISILQNFASINDSIKLIPGKTQKTMSTMKNILCIAELDMNLDLDEPICLYSLSKFLKLVKLLPAPTLEVIENHTIIIRGCDDSTLSYRLTDETIIVSPPNKTIDLPSEEVYFTLSERDVSNCVKVAAGLGVLDFSIVGDGETLSLRVWDKKNSGSDSYEVSIGETELTFCANLKIENLKMRGGNYEVTISKNNLMKLEAEELTYFLAVEPDSEWETDEVETEEKVETIPYVTTGEKLQQEELEEELVTA